jgi:hypothetical protein
MKLNKMLSVFAVSAAAALSASAQDVTGYIPVAISGTVTVQNTNVVAAGTQMTFGTTVTTIDNKYILRLFYYWYNTLDGNPAVDGGFLTGGYTLAVQWDYTTLEPAFPGVPHGTGDIVVVDKENNLVYDPNTSPSLAAPQFQISLDWDNALATDGKIALVPANANGYGAGSLNYVMNAGFQLGDQGDPDTSSIAPATLYGYGKGTETAIFDGLGDETNVEFSIEGFGVQGNSYLGNPAVVDLKISGRTPFQGAFRTKH